VLYIRLAMLTVIPQLHEMDRLYSCIRGNSTAYIAATYVVSAAMHRLIATFWFKMLNTDAMCMLFATS